MNEKQKARLDKVKKYVTDKAPEIITATCAVSLTTVALVVVNQHAKNMRIAQQAVLWCWENGKEYTYHPGVGIFLKEDFGAGKHAFTKK